MQGSPSQISEENDENDSPSERELHDLRRMLPEPINRLDHYLIQENTEEHSSASYSPDEQEMLLKITQQVHQILDLQERLYYYRTECMRLLEENQQMKAQQRQLQETASHRGEQLADAQRRLEEEYLRVGQLEKQLRSSEERAAELGKAVERGAERRDREISFRNTYNQQLLSKELLVQEKLILELTSKNERLLKINGLLEVQLRQAEEKLINFEIDVQQKMCSILADNVSRLKENGASRHSLSPSLSHTHNAKANFASTGPIEENKTVKLGSVENNHAREFRTIEKDRILKNTEHRYEPKLQPVDSPKPQRKSNRIHSFLRDRDDRLREATRLHF